MVKLFDSGNGGVINTRPKRFRGVVSRVGVFPYVINNRLYWQFRPPEEVLNRDSVESLLDAALTIEHPEDDEDPNTFHGSVINVTPKPDELTIEGDIVCMSDSATQLAKSGSELSPMYDVILREQTGEYQGKKYDLVQTNIRYSSLGLVGKGRQGDSVKVFYQLSRDSLSQQPTRDQEIVSVPSITVPASEILANAGLVTPDGQPLTPPDSTMKFDQAGNLIPEAAPAVATQGINNRPPVSLTQSVTQLQDGCECGGDTAQQPVAEAAGQVLTPPAPAAQQPVVQQPTVQQPVVQQPVAQQPVAQQTVATAPQPIVETPAQQPVVQQPVAQQPLVQQPAVQQPVAQQPVAQQPQIVVEQPTAKPPSVFQPQPEQTAVSQPPQQVPLVQQNSEGGLNVNKDYMNDVVNTAQMASQLGIMQLSDAMQYGMSSLSALKRSILQHRGIQLADSADVNSAFSVYTQVADAQPAPAATAPAPIAQAPATPAPIPAAQPAPILPHVAAAAAPQGAPNLSPALVPPPPSALSVSQGDGANHAAAMPVPTHPLHTGGVLAPPVPMGNSSVESGGLNGGQKVITFEDLE